MKDSFKLLEDRVRRAAERLQALKGEADSLRRELAEARSRTREAEQRLAAIAEGAQAADPKKADDLAREVKALRRERDEIRSRVEHLLELLDQVE